MFLSNTCCLCDRGFCLCFGLWLGLFIFIFCNFFIVFFLHFCCPIFHFYIPDLLFRTSCNAKCSVAFIFDPRRRITLQEASKKKQIQNLLPFPPPRCFSSHTLLSLSLSLSLSLYTKAGLSKCVRALGENGRERERECVCGRERGRVKRATRKLNKKLRDKYPCKPLHPLIPRQTAAHCALCTVHAQKHPQQQRPPSPPHNHTTSNAHPFPPFPLPPPPHHLVRVCAASIG